MPSPRLSAELRHKGLDCLLYLAHPANITSILEHGILSYNRVGRARIQHQSIADQGVQGRRTRTVRVTGRSLHDYVPLFMARRNPMLWRVQSHPLCYVRVSLDAADKDGTVFSDGNAACDETDFYQNASDIDKVPWDVVLGRRWTGSRIIDGKRKRAAEVLIPELIETSYILDIRCQRLDNLDVPVGLSHLLVRDPSFLVP